MKSILQNLVIFNMLSCSSLSAISVVYNFRIAEITKEPLFENPNYKHFSILALVFDKYQKKYNGTRQNFVGELSSLIYAFKESYYLRTDFAVSHIHETVDCVTTFRGTETDDVLFTLGRNFNINKKSTVTLSGLFGIPTHKLLGLAHVDFGYGQFGLGVQIDGAYKLHSSSSILYGARCTNFISRNAQDSYCNTYNFTRGSIADVLIAYKKRWGKHGLEWGYAFRSDFGAHIVPNLDDTVKKTNYLRSDFYVVYKNTFLIKNIQNRILLNIAYGFDHKPKIYGNKNVVFIWGSWRISF
jgi:hypothetical protein